MFKGKSNTKAPHKGAVERAKKQSPDLAKRTRYNQTVNDTSSKRSSEDLVNGTAGKSRY